MSNRITSSNLRLSKSNQTNTQPAVVSTLIKVKGKVLSSDNKPLKGAKITSYKDRTTNRMILDVESSDNSGNFEITTLRYGSFFINYGNSSLEVTARGLNLTVRTQFKLRGIFENSNANPQPVAEPHRAPIFLIPTAIPNSTPVYTPPTIQADIQQIPKKEIEFVKQRIVAPQSNPTKTLAVAETRINLPANDLVENAISEDVIKDDSPETSTPSRLFAGLAILGLAYRLRKSFMSSTK